MKRKKRILIILGIAIGGVAFCGGIEYFFFSNERTHAPPPSVAVPQAQRPLESETPESSRPAHATVVPKEKSASSSSLPSPAPKDSLPPRKIVPKPVAAASNPSSPSRTLAAVDKVLTEEQVKFQEPVAPKAPPTIELAQTPPTAEPVPMIVPATSPSVTKEPESVVTAAPSSQHYEPKATPVPQAVVQAPSKELPAASQPLPTPAAEKQVPVADLKQPEAADEDGPELLMQPKVGYGVRYYEIQQTGAFGGIKGSNIAMNVLSVETNVQYGAWSLQAGLEKFSSEFAGSTTDLSIKSDKDFKHFYLKPGYGIFFLGLDAKTSPIVRASGTTLQWADLTTLSAVGGFRLEKLYNTRRRKPFLLGLGGEASYPLGASGDGGGPSISTPSGFGLSLRGYVEKAIFRREDYQLYFGLDGSAAYDQIKFNGTWNGSSGDATRTIQEYGSKIYLKFDF